MGIDVGACDGDHWSQIQQRYTRIPGPILPFISAVDQFRSYPKEFDVVILKGRCRIGLQRSIFYPKCLLRFFELLSWCTLLDSVGSLSTESIIPGFEYCVPFTDTRGTD